MNREQLSEGHKLERVFRWTMGAGLLGSIGVLALSFRAEQASYRLESVLGILLCSAMFVRWTELPFLKRKVADPGPFLGVVSRLLLAVSIGFQPLLISRGHYLLVAAAIGLSVACAGLWFRWRWIVWSWYLLLLAGFLLGARALWQDVLGEESSLIASVDLVMRLPGFLIWMAFLFELVAWQRRTPDRVNGAKGVDSDVAPGARAD